MPTQPLNQKSPLPRIAMVSTHGYVASAPPLGAADTGGQVVYVLELSKKLAQLGFEVDIWTRRFESQEQVDPVSDRVRIIRIPCGGTEFIPKEWLCEKIPEWSENALRFIKKNGLKYRFVNSHYWDAGLAGQRLAESLNAPHVHTPHSLGLWKLRQMETDFPQDRERLNKLYNFDRRNHDERILYLHCDLVVATTPPQLDFLEETYEAPREKCRMIPPGYDDTRFYPVGDGSRKAIRQRLGYSGRVVLAVGRLARNKGYDLLIQAFKIVAEREPAAVLHLAIGGTSLNPNEQQLFDEYQKLTAQLGLADRVRFFNYIPDDELADHYRAADQFVLSSRYEPFGMTAIEAMACGTPTVVTTQGGLYRAVTFGRHALYADPFDPEDLGITMMKIFRHPRLRCRLSRMGAHKARSLFTWTGVAQQLIAAIEQRPSTTLTLDDDEWDEPWNDGD